MFFFFFFINVEKKPLPQTGNFIQKLSNRLRMLGPETSALHLLMCVNKCMNLRTCQFYSLRLECQHFPLTASWPNKMAQQFMIDCSQEQQLKFGITASVYLKLFYCVCVCVCVYLSVYELSICSEWETHSFRHKYVDS